MTRKRTGRGDHRTQAATAQPVPQSADPPRTEQSNPALPTDTAADNKVGTAKRKPATLIHVEVVRGGCTNVKAPVAVGYHYQGLPLSGAAQAFDHQIDSWLSRALPLGIIGSGLGQLFLFPLPKTREAGKVAADNLLLVGLGEPGHFALDDLRFVMANVTVAVKGLGHPHLSTGLIGMRRNDLLTDRALRAFLTGVLDGTENFRAMLEGVTEDRERFQQAADAALFISLVEEDEHKAKEIHAALDTIRQEGSIDGLQLEVGRGEDVPPDPAPPPNPPDVDPDGEMTLLRVTNSPRPGAMHGPRHGRGTSVFQYSAVADRSALAVREVKVNPYFVRQLPDRLAKATRHKEQEDFGTFFTNYLLPDDFRRLVEDSEQLTLVVDETTAAYPWEMAAFKKHSRTCFFGTDLRLARQFRSLLAPPPGFPPPLNHNLRVLVIADPASGALSLPRARVEGLAVVEVLSHAARAWGKAYDLKVVVRVGAHQDRDQPETQAVLERLRQQHDLVESADVCDPVELAMLIVNEHFDVLHYAGHGVFDPAVDRAGWVFDQDCVLSAEEIFRVRQVPRLVFANACFSAATTEHADQRRQLVGLAQAFFARGIQNYIGTGWEVNDRLAAQCARYFYRRVLGLRLHDGDAVVGTAPPATIGQALADARAAILPPPNAADDGESCSTWGAYQHYGRANDKLLPLPNV